MCVDAGVDENDLQVALRVCAPGDDEDSVFCNPDDDEDGPVLVPLGGALHRAQCEFGDDEAAREVL